MRKQQILGAAIVLGAALLLLLIVVSALSHPPSIQGPGRSLFWTDVVVLAFYGIAGIIAWNLKQPSAVNAAASGAQIGLLIGVVGITNHLIEAFVPARPFALVIAPVLLTLALLGMAGAIAWEKSHSIPLAVCGGLFCAIVLTLVTLGFAASFNLIFVGRVDWNLREAFAASGMFDPAAFRVRNILEASSEIMVGMPVLASCLAFSGALMQFSMTRFSRNTPRMAAACIAPALFLIGVAALWYANTLERAQRPPFVFLGALLAAASLSAAYPIWSVLHTSISKPQAGAT